MKPEVRKSLQSDRIEISKPHRVFHINSKCPQRNKVDEKAFCIVNQKYMKNSVNLHPTYSLQVYVLQSTLYNLSIIITKYTIY